MTRLITQLTTQGPSQSQSCDGPCVVVVDCVMSVMSVMSLVVDCVMSVVDCVMSVVDCVMSKTHHTVLS